MALGILQTLGIMLCSWQAQATDFVSIVRLSAAHPSVLSSRFATQAISEDITAIEAQNSLKVSGGLGSTAYSGQPGYENNLVSPHLNLSKMLYDHGRVAEQKKGKEAEWQMQAAQSLATRETISQQILSLYSSALADARVGQVLEKQVASLQDLLQRVKTIGSVDTGRASEVNQVAARLTAVQANLRARETSRQQNWTQLTQLVNQQVELTNGLPDLKLAGLLPVSLPVAEELQKKNATVVAASYRRDAAESALRLASKYNKPKWQVQLSVDSPRRDGHVEYFRAVTLQFSSDIDIIDGGAGAATYRGEGERLNSAEQELAATQRAAHQELAQLWVSLPLREAQIRALKEQVHAAEITWQAGETQFFAGRRPLTDLISFSSDYYSSLASYEEQRVMYLNSQWKIIAAIGKLSELADKHKQLTAPVIAVASRNRYAE